LRYYSYGILKRSGNVLDFGGNPFGAEPRCGGGRTFKRTQAKIFFRRAGLGADMRTAGWVACLVLAASAGIAPATAQQAPEWRSCTGKPDVKPDVQIRSCTALIQSPKETAKTRALAYFNRAQAYNYFDRVERDRAIADLVEAIKLDPGLAEAYKTRALFRGMNGDRDGAIADLGEAIRLDPNDTQSLISRGQAYVRKGDPDRAIADYDAVIRLDPKNATAYMSRGNAYQGKRDYDRAVADLSEAIRIDPKYQTAYFFRGNAYLAKSDNDRAIADHSEVIRLDPKSTTSYARRGMAYAAKGDRDRAITDFRKALELTPKYEPAIKGLEALGIKP
jgi:tetratricopeptide (TPR) repeat protein